MKTHLKKYLDEEKICRHTTSKSEVAHLFDIVKRDLKDASVVAISSDRRHATAYNAVLQLATIALHAAGYRAKSKVGHHWVTFMLLPEIMGKEFVREAKFFNLCREQRNLTDYDLSGHITRDEVDELMQEAAQFRKLVVAWMKKHHPTLIT